MATGQLYVCATPIGNLEDITLRVLRVLGEVDLVAAEDTRRTRQLLAHYDIHVPLISLHEHNEAARTAGIVARLAAGESVALVSDAGIPGISDPGARLIKAVIDADIPLTVLPGPTAVVTALVGSGLPTERFAFEGFLPRSPRRRRAVLQALRDEPRTLVFYEAPHRIGAALQDMAETLGPRPACVARELTKAFEQWHRDTLNALAEAWRQTPAKGEFVIVVAGAPSDERGEEGGEAEVRRSLAEPTSAGGDGGEPTEADLIEAVRAEMDGGLDKKAAVQRVARRLRLPRRAVYRAAISIDASKD